MDRQSVIYGPSLLTDHDIYLFKEGSHFKLYEKLGSHIMAVDGVSGTLFAVWAPNAKSVSVTGDFNAWDSLAHLLRARSDGSGIWEGFIPGVGHGDIYKYHITSAATWYAVDKGDPFARRYETPPRSGSVVWDSSYEWEDRGWMESRAAANALNAPQSVYEVHPGSWRRAVAEDGSSRFLTYREMAEVLPDYVREMGFTHVEFMPVMEHPFYGSWGYQTLGYFAPTSRYGDPQDFKFLVDRLHQAGVGVVLDWVPSHFPSDEHGLIYFDGTSLFEHSDPRQGFHPEWKSTIFNHGRYEVRAFLISSALFWMEQFHADGLRVDAVASMLYLDYSRKEGEWIPNCFGGRENLEAVEFIKRFNEAVYREHPDTFTVAEESTAWPMVSRPVHLGGLGFGLKWNMGWMHDTLEYFSMDSVFRKYHQNQLTFSIWYAFYENFILPLSHDEVVYGKGSILGKMPGDDWQKFANLRALYGYMFAHPGKKLLFMGAEFGQRDEWYHEKSLDWHLLEYAPHQGIQRWVKDLNEVYRSEPALHRLDFSNKGFEWVDFRDADSSIVGFIRKGDDTGDMFLVVANLTPVPRKNYRMGAPCGGFWKEVLNSDAEVYGGCDLGNGGGVMAEPIPCHGRLHSLSLVLPPLGIVYFKSSGPAEKKEA